jgi:hypothetical protein
MAAHNHKDQAGGADGEGCGRRVAARGDGGPRIATRWGNSGLGDELSVGNSRRPTRQPCGPRLSRLVRGRPRPQDASLLPNVEPRSVGLAVERRPKGTTCRALGQPNAALIAVSAIDGRRFVARRAVGEGHRRRSNHFARGVWETQVGRHVLGPDEVDLQLVPGNRVQQGCQACRSPLVDRV